MKKFFLIASTLGMMGFMSCFAVSSQPTDYSVEATLSTDDDGATAYLINYDNNQKVDSCIVDDGTAKFSGKIAAPMWVRLIVGGNRYGSFILEPTTITISNKEAVGGELNAAINRLEQQSQQLIDSYNKLPQDDQAGRDSIQAAYMQLMDSTFTANIHNPIGYYLFLQRAYEMDLPEIEAALAQNPDFGNYERVQKIVAAARQKQLTSVGHKFVDFEVESPDGVHRLSDYVGKGKYVLVDFWASWCGPCIRETQTLKKLLQELGPQGLEVLGVAVWDEPDNTLQAINKHQLPWPQIINAQYIPTDLYGISGIPCIILFGPDGTILVRDKQGDDLVKAVKDAFVPDKQAAPLP